MQCNLLERSSSPDVLIRGKSRTCTLQIRIITFSLRRETGEVNGRDDHYQKMARNSEKRFSGLNRFVEAKQRGNLSRTRSSTLSAYLNTSGWCLYPNRRNGPICSHVVLIVNTPTSLSLQLSLFLTLYFCIEAKGEDESKRPSLVSAHVTE